MTVGYIGLACIVAAVVGGGLELAEAKFPLVSTVGRQIVLGAVGVVLCALAFVKHEVNVCSGWLPTVYSNQNPDLIYNVPDPETDRIVTAYVETHRYKEGGGRIDWTISSNATGTGVTGKCSAAADATSNGLCRIHAVLNTTLIQRNDCKPPLVDMAPK